MKPERISFKKCSPFTDTALLDNEIGKKGPVVVVTMDHLHVYTGS